MTVASLLGTGVVLHRGAVFFGGVAIVAVVLVIEHRLVRPKDASAGPVDFARIGKAFFDCNAYVSLGFFVTTAHRRRAPLSAAEAARRGLTRAGGGGRPSGPTGSGSSWAS